MNRSSARPRGRVPGQEQRFSRDRGRPPSYWPVPRCCGVAGRRLLYLHGRGPLRAASTTSSGSPSCRAQAASVAQQDAVGGKYRPDCGNDLSARDCSSPAESTAPRPTARISTPRAIWRTAARRPRRAPRARGSAIAARRRAAAPIRSVHQPASHGSSPRVRAAEDLGCRRVQGLAEEPPAPAVTGPLPASFTGSWATRRWR